MLISSIVSKFYDAYSHPTTTHLPVRREESHHDAVFVGLACLIPVLVLLSGIFAGLTLGYMSLDETQLNVLATSGTPLQREYAKRIIPVRKNGHLLLVSLLLANMVVNETLPVVSVRILGGGVSAVAVSTVLIVIFAEIIPQSICSRYGLYIGAKCAIPVRILMYALAIIAWPVAKLLETILGPHHGIIYRRAELKELINMHSSISPHGGDLKHDTVAIIGHTLDLQEKVVRDAMTPIEDVFMLPIDAHLDYETLRRVCESGHSRVPVYDEVVIANKRAKKIVGILLVKQCVLLDPKDATPLRSIPLNKVPSVPFDEPLFGILDRFQEGRSHMAIVSLFSKGRAASVKEAVKTGLTRRFLNRVGLGEDGDQRDQDVERASCELRSGIVGKDGEIKKVQVADKERTIRLPAGIEIEGREQAMPADAVLASEDADNFLRGLDLEINPLGIITLEDVLEELIGEEILDEFDLTGPQAASRYIPPSARRAAEEQHRYTPPTPALPFALHAPTPLPAPATAAIRGASGLTTLQFPKMPSIFSRSRSQPGAPRPEPIEDDGAQTLDPEGTDTNTLRVTLTSETSTTVGAPCGLVVSESEMPLGTLQPVFLSAPSSIPHPPSSASKQFFPTSSVTQPQPLLTPTPAPRVTEAILQTQTRRRAQLQQQVQAHSASSLPLPTGPTSLAIGGELQLPVPRQVSKGRFKSSPLVPSARSEDRGDPKEKMSEADLPSDDIKHGGL